MSLTSIIIDGYCEKVNNFFHFYKEVLVKF